jgi:aryl-alcohol dehydrogenase-like predicted oxidoreductase
METRQLGKTDIQPTVLGFGASSLGAEFRNVDLNECLQSVHIAMEVGMNFIDTSPYYGRGMSEVMLGRVLPELDRGSYTLCTKLGRYAPNHFDFSAKRVEESVDISLERMKVDHLDIVILHDIEFGNAKEAIDSAVPALKKQIEKGKVRYIGASCYPIKTLLNAIEWADLDVVLSYNHYTLQNDMATQLLGPCAEKGVGVMNAAPFTARLLTSAPLPEWHKATPEVREVAKKAVDFCKEQGTDIAKLALQYSLAHPGFATCISGSANPDRIRQWAAWAGEPMDEALIAEVKKILEPIHNWHHIEGLPENNDTPTNPLPTNLG